MTIAGKRLNRRGKVALLIIAFIIVVSASLSFRSVDGGEVEEETPVITESTTSILSDDLEEISIVVREGETAWDIQSQLTPDKDIAEILEQLEQLNDMSLDNIKSGSVIKFAVEG